MLENLFDEFDESVKNNVCLWEREKERERFGTVNNRIMMWHIFLLEDDLI